MSFGYPPLHSRLSDSTVSHVQKGPFGVPDILLSGFEQAKNELRKTHPLDFKESQHESDQEIMEFSMLRNMQGLHAPLHLKMERQIVDQVQRLPGLHSSRIMSDNLTGRLDEMTFVDILNDPMDAEMIGHSHLLMEQRQGF